MQKTTVMALPRHIVEELEGQAIKSPQRLRKEVWTARFKRCRENAFLFAAAFLLGRLVLLGDLSPFGLGFFAAAAQAARAKALLVGGAAVVGVLSAGRYAEAALYAVSMLLCMHVQRRLTRAERKFVSVPLTVAAAMLAGGLLLNYARGAALYDDVVVLFNALLCLAASFLFVYGMPLLTDRAALEQAYEKPANEAMLCCIAVLALAIAGLGDLSFEGYRLQQIGSGVLVMTLALAGGAGLGATVGIVVGVVVGLSGSAQPLTAIALYGIGGMFAGLFKPLGKFAVILGFLFGSMIVHLSFTQVPLLMHSLAETACAASLLLFVPLGRVASLEKKLSPAALPTPSCAMLEGGAKLESVASLLTELADAMRQEGAAAQPAGLRQGELDRLFGAVGQRLCESCENRAECWEEQYSRTYEALLDIFNRLDKRPLQGGDLPLAFRTFCMHAGRMAEVINDVTEKNQAQQYWRQKLAEQRAVLCGQMRAVGNIAATLAAELGRGPSDGERTAAELAARAERLGCAVEDVKAAGRPLPRQLTLRKAPCGGRGECAATLLPLASGVLRQRLTMVKKCGDAARGRRCEISLRAMPLYSVQAAVATVAKEGRGVSGDSVKILPLPCGKFSVVLSDGMGSGGGAAAESRLTVDALSRLLTQGFDVDTAVKTVNSLLLLRDAGEQFATVDMAVVDKYTGEAEFLKIAAAPAYVKRVREVREVQAEALPIGILQHVEMRPVKMQLAANDVVVMLSDGVADSKDVKRRKEDKEGWLVQFLRRAEVADEQKFAEALLQEAVQIAGGKATDDMTVLVLRISDAGLLQ